MSRPFSLAGLLRLRQVQEDIAAGELSAARQRLDVTNVRQQHARTALGATTSDVTSTAALYALAAGRASVRSTLSDLDALGRTHQSEEDAASAAYTEARRQSLSIEKLEARQRERDAAEELLAQQHLLDELATTKWSRENEGDQP